MTCERLPPSGLLGRSDECDALDQLVADVIGGESRVLLLRGEAGVGKSVLLRYLVTKASVCRVEHAVGVESEMQLAFAGLHQLCAPMLDHLDRLPRPQAEAIRTAFGLTVGDRPDRFFVALAVLNLLAEVAEERPLICVVDDAQWLDRVSAQTLSFVARRLSAERIALVFAAREASEAQGLEGLPEMVVGNLSKDDAAALLGSAIRGPLDARVRDLIIAETRGNPLALLELPRGLSHAELAGGFGLPNLAPISAHVEQRFVRELADLPPDTRRVLLVAAADAVGDVTLVWRAAQQLGVAPEALAEAEGTGLLRVGARVHFRHPLVRSAVYRAASLTERQTVHHALAEATDPDTDPDRRAWHRAQATPGLDDAVAEELERAAGRALARGGAAAAAAFFERATELTASPRARAGRALVSSRLQFEAGARDKADELLTIAELGLLDELQRAEVERLRAEMSFATHHGHDAPPLLLRAAKRLEPLNPELARDTYLVALSAALYVGRIEGPGGLREVANAARAAVATAESRRAADVLLEGLALLVTDGYQAGASVVLEALTMFRASEEPGKVLPWLWLAIRASGAVWDDTSWDVLTRRHLQNARERGALAELPVALAYRASILIHSGALEAASALIEQASDFASVIGSSPVSYASLMLSAWQGRADRVGELVGTNLAERTSAGGDGSGAAVGWMRAVLYNSLGRYEEAFVAAQIATRDAHLPLPYVPALPELVESAARSGKVEVANESLRRLGETTQASGQDWALGIEARSSALLSPPERAEPLYCEAIDKLSRTRITVDAARAHLLYGEWLRRGNRRIDARKELRIAYEMFSRFGADGFAERARRELHATGELVQRHRSDPQHNVLTSQEAQIARLAAEGKTNPEIGAQLFISPRTVEYHLHKVFGKLGVSSRRELRDALPKASDVSAA